MDVFAVKVDGSDVNTGICLYENLFTDSLVDITSVNFNSKKVYEDELFGRQDILQFFSGESKDYSCSKSNILQNMKLKSLWAYYKQNSSKILNSHKSIELL